MHRAQPSQAGFSLVELLIATALMIIVGVIAMQSMHAATTAMQHANRIQDRVASIDTFASQLRYEAASSDAVWVAQGSAGPELHYMLLDGSGQSRHWYYRFGATLERVDARSGAVSRPSEAAAVTSFTARAMPASALGGSLNSAAAVFADAPTATDARYTIDTDGITGNGVSVVTLASRTESREVHILSGPSASSFGIEQGVFWHSVTWRETSTRRGWLGLAQKSRYHINAEVAYTTDNWRSSRVWCSYDLYGALDVSDGRAQPAYYDEKTESAKAIFKECQRRTGQRAIPSATPNPGVKYLQ